jgi:hypothetical protein
MIRHITSPFVAKMILTVKTVWSRGRKVSDVGDIIGYHAHTAQSNEWEKGVGIGMRGTFLLRINMVKLVSESVGHNVCFPNNIIHHHNCLATPILLTVPRIFNW